MNFRKYKTTDANEILNWISNEREFRLWSADRYEKYPISEKELNKNYKKCMEQGNFYPMTLTDDNENIIGHLILRNPSDDKSIIRLGFIIIDNKIRRTGLGKILIKKAIEYAQEKLSAKIITLGVFSNNEQAYNCYKSCGFKYVKTERNGYVFKNENWDCIEMIFNCNKK